MPGPAQRAMVVCLALGSVPTIAAAANGNQPRTPPIYPPHACLAIVDREVDPIWRMSVAIPYEDTTITADELPDSRTFQFFALCHDDVRHVLLPNWVARSDAQRALDAGIVPELPDPEQVLREATHWRGGHDGAAESCVQAIVPDDARVPISCAATADPIAWDTTGVPAGNYVVRGYTFAPVANLWTPRLGVVQVVDGMDELRPVAALTSPVYDARAFQQAGYRVTGCMGGPPGTTVELAWASTAAPDLDDDGAWTVFATLDAADGVIDERLVPPVEAVYLGLLVRAVARDEAGHSWIAHALGFITVYPDDGMSDDPKLPAGPDHCGVGGDSSGGTASSQADTSSTGDVTSGGSDAGSAADDHSGCGCHVDAPVDRRALVLGAIVALARPRRRLRARHQTKAGRAGRVRAKVARA